MNNLKYFYAFVTVAVVSVIFIGATLYNPSINLFLNNQTSNNPSTKTGSELVIENVDEQPIILSTNNNTIIDFNLNISLNLTFYQSQSITNWSGLGPCSFVTSLINASNWTFSPQNYMCPLLTNYTYQPGSYNFFINKKVVPVNSYYNLTYPFSIQLSVKSNPSSNLQVQSQVYTLNFNYPNQSISINTIQLVNDTNSNGQTSYSINANFTFTTGSEIDVKFPYCWSPFTLILLSPNNWNLTSIHCLVEGYSLKHLNPGSSSYSLSEQLVFPDGSIYNSTYNLPSEFSFKVILPQYAISSDIYTMVIH